MTHTQNALLSYEIVEQRAKYFTEKIKKLTFGEYSEDVLILAPFVTGNIEFHALELKFYYNYYQERAGLKYELNF